MVRRRQRRCAQSFYACLTACTLISLSIVFFTFPCSWLAVNVSVAFPCTSGILFILTLVNFVLACFKDPGISSEVSDIEDKLKVQTVTVNDKSYQVKWCRTCQFLPPPRTVHCQQCNICVEESAHHSKCVNNCIGYKNYHFFFHFVLFLVLYKFTVLTFCITYLVFNSREAFTIEKTCTVALIFPVGIFVFPFLFLLGIQIQFLSSLQRPHLEITNHRLQGPNSYFHGWRKNMCFILFAPAGPRYVVNSQKNREETLPSISVAEKMPIPRSFPAEMEFSARQGVSSSIVTPKPVITACSFTPNQPAQVAEPSTREMSHKQTDVCKTACCQGAEASAAGFEEKEAVNKACAKDGGMTNYEKKRTKDNKNMNPKNRSTNDQTVRVEIPDILEMKKLNSESDKEWKFEADNRSQFIPSTLTVFLQTEV